MKVVFPVNQKTMCLKIPNALVINRFSFWLIKMIFGIKFHPLFKIKYKHIKPIIKKSKEYKDFEIVNISTRQGEKVVICI